MRTPTWKQLERFCRVEGWEDADKARGRPTGDHKRYRLRLPNGDVLRTRVSHGTGQVDARLFSHILHDQLQVSAEEFWTAVDKGTAPVRAREPEPPRGHRLPARLVEPLHQLGVPDTELVKMSVEQAELRLREERRRPSRRRNQP